MKILNSKYFFEEGVSYSISKFHEIILISVLPFLASIILYLIQILLKPSLGNIFVLETLKFIISSFFTLFAFQFLIRKSSEFFQTWSFREHSIFAISNSPKILLLLWLFVFLLKSALVFPLFIFVLPMIVWAPFFCALDVIYSIGNKSGEERDSDALFSGFFENSFFSLGLLRSYSISKDNIVLTLKIALLFFFVNTVPFSLALLFFSYDDSGHFLQVLRILLTTLMQGFSLYVSIYIFLKFLPQDKFKAVRISLMPQADVSYLKKDDNNRLLNNLKKNSFYILLIFGLLSAYIAFNTFKKELGVPKDINFKIEKIVKIDSDLKFDVSFNIAQDSFIWLSTGNFYLLLGENGNFKTERVKAKSLPDDFSDPSQNLTKVVSGQEQIKLSLDFALNNPKANEFKIFFISDLAGETLLTQGVINE